VKKEKRILLTENKNRF